MNFRCFVKLTSVLARRSKAAFMGASWRSAVRTDEMRPATLEDQDNRSFLRGSFPEFRCSAKGLRTGL